MDYWTHEYKPGDVVGYIQEALHGTPAYEKHGTVVSYERVAAYAKKHKWLFGDMVWCDWEDDYPGRTEMSYMDARYVFLVKSAIEPEPKFITNPDYEDLFE